MAYAGLSGAFGTVSLGQVWSASFNHVGGITDGSWFYGNSETSYRVGNALSYAMSAGAVSLQLDAIMDGGKDTGESVDQLEFGMSIDLGDIGKVGLAYVDKKDYMVPVADKFMPGTATAVKVTAGEPGTAPTVTVTEGTGTPTVPTVVEEMPNEVATEFTFEVGEDGELTVLEAKGLTKDEFAALTKEQKESFMYEDDAVKYSTHLDVDTEGSSEGTIQTAKETGTVEREVTRVSIIANFGEEATISLSGANMIADDATVKPTESSFKKIGNVYVHSDCLTDDLEIDTSTNKNCGNAARTVYKVSYTQAIDGQTIDGETKRQNKGSFTSDNTLIMATADGTRVDGTKLEITPGTQGTPVEVTTTPGEAATPPTVEVTPGTPGDFVEQPDKKMSGSRDTHIAAQFNLGAITAYLGYSQSEENGASMKDKTTHYGISGGLGDTGMSFHLMARNKDNASGMDTNPWLVGLTKGLGGGATVMVEHGNADDGESGKTRFGLKVDF